MNISGLVHGFGSFFALGAIVTLQAIVRISAPEEQVLHLIVLCQSLTILFGSMDLFVYWYRYKNKAAITAQYRICSFLLAAVWLYFSYWSIP